MVDFQQYRSVSFQEMLKTGGSAHGGLTVRDYFAARAMIEMTNYFTDEATVAEKSYSLADAMMKERNKPVQQPAPSVEEAFGLDK